MFIKAAMRAPFYFFAGEDGAGAGGGAPSGATTVVTEVIPAPAGAPGSVAPPAAALGTPPATPPVLAAGKEPPAAAAPPPADKKDPPSAKPPLTAAEGAPPKESDPKPPADWPDDWRAKLAGDDKKLIDRLSRMKSPTDLLNAYRELEGQLSSGKFAKKLPTHYTAEELADYKKANGIPDKASDYDDNLGNGIVWGETDKPHIDDFKAFALEHNMTPDQVKQGLGWWAQYQEKLVQDLDASDQNNSALARTELRALWGGKHDGNLAFLRNQFEGQKGMWATLMTARGPDGRLLGDNPDAVKFLHQKFAEADPQAADAAMSGTGSAPGATDPEDEYNKTIRPLMGDKNSKYWKGPERDAIQARARDLIGLIERKRERAAAAR